MMADSMTEVRLRRLLRNIQALAEQVRVIADRVHQETEEAHRLAETVRAELERSRELSRSGRDELLKVHGSLERSLDAARYSVRPAPEDSEVV
jgi:hypothetical protein